MPKSPFKNCLRFYRKRFGLTQSDIAFLIGGANRRRIYLHEANCGDPDLYAALAYQMIFQTTAEELFGRLAHQVKQETTLRIKELLNKLDRQDSALYKHRKIAFLRRLIGEQA